MKAIELRFVLAELSFAADLPGEVLEHLAAAAAVQSLSGGAAVFREGSDNRNIFLIHRGRVALEMTVPGRGRSRILTLGPGEMFGWSALLGPGPMTASAVAVEDAELIAVPGEYLGQLCEANHDFGFHLMRQMALAISKRLVATRLQLLDLFASPAEIDESARREVPT